MQIGVTQGRVNLHLPQPRQRRERRGRYPARQRLAAPARCLRHHNRRPGSADANYVFEGSARFVGGGADLTIKAGDAAVLNGSETVSATVERAASDDFAKWCRSRDYHHNQLAASYRVSQAMTGFEELDAYGGWATAPDYGAVWYPNSVPADWAPYREGHWVWIEPWGWSWVDAEPWGFAPFHYGRWARIEDRWGWVPGNFVPQPVYAPALVAFIEAPGIGLSAPADTGPQSAGSRLHRARSIGRATPVTRHTSATLTLPTSA